MDHATFAEALSTLDDLDDLPADLADHAATCVTCQQRVVVMQRVLETAHTADEDDVIDVTQGVLEQTHPAPRRRSWLTAAAAAAVLLVVGGVVVVQNRSGNDTDVLADVANQYEQTDGLRFVYSSESTIDILDEFELAIGNADVRPMSTTIPTCDRTESTEDSRFDLQPIVDALASDDPCLALQLVDDSAAPAREAYVALAASIEQRTHLVDQLERLEPDPSRPLAQASARAFLDAQADAIDTDEQTLRALENSFARIARTVDPLATDASTVGVSAAAVESDLVALSATTTNAERALEAAIDHEQISWSQIATGTWTSAGIKVEGTVEQDEASATFTSVETDPLALTNVLLADPAILIDILRSAPPNESDTVTWTIPAGVVDDAAEWTATARLDGGELRELSLITDHTTITFTPER